ncbi:D-mannonate dehydratase [Aureococcus anophagefferens]|nr:D-mannonate dehydratase [Aureococcus anophagefferens]
MDGLMRYVCAPRSEESATNGIMEQTMRWMGPDDPVPLSTLKMAGCTGVVTALQVPAGEVWPTALIEERKALIEAAGLTWSVVESVPVHESVKLGSEPMRSHCVANYQETLRRLGACGVDVVAYNFMPVVDWTRTDLEFPWADGSKALAFDALDFAAFDVCGLERAGAERSYDAATLEKAKARWAALDEARRSDLAKTVADGVEGFKRVLAQYDGVDAAAAREHLAYFVRAVAPVAEEAGILLAIHPDDPPVPLLGLPRVPPGQRRRGDGARAFAARIHFVHLRNVKKGDAVADVDGNPVASFVESDHLDGDVPVAAVVDALLKEKGRRAGGAPNYARLPFRPDHGHQMCDDLGKAGSNPGYTAIGRLRGLAELRGLQVALLQRS